MSDVTEVNPPAEGYTSDDVSAQRAKVDALREAVRLEKQRIATSQGTGSNEVKMDALLSEEDRLRLELAQLRGPEAAAELLNELNANREEAKVVDGYIVPMGTAKVETDVVAVNREDNTDAPAPQEAPHNPTPAPSPSPITPTEPTPASPEAPAE